MLQPRYWLRWLRSCQALAACHLGIYVQAAERPRNAHTGPRQDFPSQNLRTRRSLCAHGPCAPLARRPGGPGGQRCHSSASFCAPPALRSAPTTPAPGRRLQKLGPLLFTPPAARPCPGPRLACCSAAALGLPAAGRRPCARALLLLMGRVSVGPVGLELDLWWAEYELWPARAQRRPDSCKRRCLAAQQVCTACLFRLPRFCSSPGDCWHWPRQLRSCQSLAACHLDIYVQAAERPRNAQTRRLQDFNTKPRTGRPLRTHGPCASLARRSRGPVGQRCHSSASLCATGAALSAHNARFRPTTVEACPLVVHAASSTPCPGPRLACCSAAAEGPCCSAPADV